MDTPKRRVCIYLSDPEGDYFCFDTVSLEKKIFIVIQANCSIRPQEIRKVFDSASLAIQIV